VADNVDISSWGGESVSGIPDWATEKTLKQIRDAIFKEAKSLDDMSHFLNLMRQSLDKKGSGSPDNKKKVDDESELLKLLEKEIDDKKKLKKDTAETLKTNKELIPRFQIVWYNND